MRIEGLLFSYEIMPRDRGMFAFEEVNRFIESAKGTIREVGEAEVVFNPEGVKGLILVDLRRAFSKLTDEEADSRRRRIISLLREAFDRGELLSISRVRILHKITRTNVAEIAECARIFVPYIKDRWKIEIHTKKLIDRMETIRAVAAHIDQKVDLKNPRYILHIEVIGPTITVMYLVDSENVEDTIIKL